MILLYTLIYPNPNRYEEAVAAYEEAQLLEPDNKGTKASLTQAKGKIADLEKKSALASSSGLTPCLLCVCVCSTALF